MKKETILKAINDIDDDFILEAAPKGYLQKEKPAFSRLNMKMLAGAFAILMLAVMMPSLLKPAENTPADQKPPVQLVNPAVSVETLEEAEAITGFALECPETFGEWNRSGIAVNNGKMIDVTYTDKDENARMHIRKAAGEDDISGDYNTYDSAEETSAGSKTVTLKGNDQTVSLMIFTENGYSYSVNMDEGLSREDALKLAEMIH